MNYRPFLPSWLRARIVDAQFLFPDAPFARLEDMRLLCSTDPRPCDPSGDSCVKRRAELAQLDALAASTWARWRVHLPGADLARPLHLDWPVARPMLDNLAPNAAEALACFIDTQSKCRTIGALLRMGLSPEDEHRILLANDACEHARGAEGVPRAAARAPRDARTPALDAPADHAAFEQRAAHACAIEPLRRGERELCWNEPRLPADVRMVLTLVLPASWTRATSCPASLEGALHQIYGAHPDLAVAVLGQVERFIAATATERAAIEVESLLRALEDGSESRALAISLRRAMGAGTRRPHCVEDQPGAALPRLGPLDERKLRSRLRHAYLPQIRELGRHRVLPAGPDCVVCGTSLHADELSPLLACVGAPRSRFLVESSYFRAVVADRDRDRLVASMQRMDGHIERGLGGDIRALGLLGGHPAHRVRAMLREDRVDWIDEAHREFVLTRPSGRSLLAKVMAILALSCDGISACDLRDSIRRHPTFVGHDWTEAALLRLARNAPNLRVAGGFVFASKGTQTERDASAFARSIRRLFQRVGPLVAEDLLVREAELAGIPSDPARILLEIHPLLAHCGGGMYSLANCHKRKAHDSAQHRSGLHPSTGCTESGVRWTLSAPVRSNLLEDMQIALPDKCLRDGWHFAHLRNGLAVRARASKGVLRVGPRAATIAGILPGDAVLVHVDAGGRRLGLASGRRADLEVIREHGFRDLHSVHAHAALLLPT